MSTPPVGPRPPIPAGHAKCVLSGTQQGHQFRNIFYLKIDGGSVTQSDLVAVATAIATSWNTNVGPQVSGACILAEVQIVYVPSAGSELVGIWTGSHAGSNGGGTIQDASASAVVDWPITAYYRGGHPHTQQPGVPATSVANGSDLDATYRSNLATAWNSVRNAINALTEASITAVTMGTISFQTSTAGVSSWRTPPIFRPYSSPSVRLKLGSVRRRIFS